MWRCTGLRWRDGGPVWTWRHPDLGERVGAQPLGGRLAFALAADAERRCVGVRRGTRWHPCPYGAALPHAARRDQCEACSAMDRSSSVAADTRADDRRTYAVYLACFGAGLHKVGITAAARGSTRLLEQGALSFAFLGDGPLMTARRTEAVLGAALGVPDRVHSAAKRAALRDVPPPAERAASLRGLHDSAVALRERLPPALRLRSFSAVHHDAAFGLAPGPAGEPAPAPACEVTALVPGGALAGTVALAAGHDLHVLADAGRVLLDARLLSGWAFTRAAPEASLHAATRPVPRPAALPRPLF